MMTLYYTPQQIRRALGETYEFLVRLDSLRIARTGQGTLKSILGKMVGGDHNLQCANCSAKPIEIAHIVSLEEGGTNDPFNIIQLCTICHKLFDQGWISRNQITNLRLQWPHNTGLNHHFSETLLKPSHSIAGEQYAVAERQQRNILKTSGSPTARLRSKIKLIEINRRCGKAGALEQAEKDVKIVAGLSDLGEFRSWLYYEAGYVDLQLGRHQSARVWFEKSSQACNEDNSAIWKRVASDSLIIHCIISSGTHLAEAGKKLGELLQELSELTQMEAVRWA